LIVVDADSRISAKLEGLAFGPDIEVDDALKHTLFIANDNDFTGTVTDPPPLWHRQSQSVFRVCDRRTRPAHLRPPSISPKRTGIDIAGL
jgi:hypothetical protein